MLLNLFLMSDETISNLLLTGGILVGVFWVVIIFYYIFQAKK